MGYRIQRARLPITCSHFMSEVFRYYISCFLLVNAQNLCFSGITNQKLDGVIAYYPTAGIGSSELLFIIMDLLVEVQKECGCLILGIVCKYN